MKSKVIPFILFFLVLFVTSTQAQITAKGFIGDGSELTNVKSLATKSYVGYVNLPSNGTDVVANSVSITVPAAGKIFVIANGYVMFRGAVMEVFRAGITTGTSLPSIITAVRDGGASLTFTGSWSTTIIFDITTAGTYTYNCICDDNSNDPGNNIDAFGIYMSAMYFPTGGAGGGPAAAPLKSGIVNEEPSVIEMRSGEREEGIYPIKKEETQLNNSLKDSVIEDFGQRLKAMEEKLELLLKKENK
jgi:hypothetical protein